MVRLSQINLNNALIFLKVAEKRSLSLAAVELNLSLSAISHALKKLETDCGAILCHRSKTKFQLSEKGAALLKLMQPFQADFEQMMNSQDVLMNESALLSIGLGPNFNLFDYTKALQLTVQRFPKINLSIQIYQNKDLNRKLESLEVDIGFGFFQSRSPQLHYLHLHTEKMNYYISEAHPLWNKKEITVRDLTDQSFQRLQPNNYSREEVTQEFLSNKLFGKYRVNAFTNGLTSALELLMCGSTVVALPDWFVEKKIKGLKIRQLSVKLPVTKCNLECAYNPSGMTKPHIKFFIENLISNRKV